MSLTGAAKVAGVLGWPVGHSLSPLMHGRWIAAAGLDAVYAPFEVQPERFVEALTGLRASGVVGVNVTLPHKERALALADEATPRAQAIGAANVLKALEDSGWRAENTDVDGVVYALRETAPAGDRTALLLGAGGAARGALYALLSMGWRSIAVTNRSPERAEALCADASGWEMEGGGVSNVWPVAWEERDAAAREAALILNATSLGMTGQPPLALDLSHCAPDTVVFDSVYTPNPTPLLAQAQERGLRAIDGLDMLIGQAIPSFEAFYGQAPPVLDNLRADLFAALEARR